MANPTPLGDMMLQPDELEIIDQLPEGQVGSRVRGFDIAYTGTAASDDSGHGLLLQIGGEVILADGDSWVRPWHETKAIITKTLLSDPPGVFEAFETNGGQEALVDDLKRSEDLLGCSIFGFTSDESKQLRALPWMLRAKGKSFKMLRGPWNAKFLDQLHHFRATGKPKYCGFIDSVSKAWECMSKTVDYSAWVNSPTEKDQRRATAAA